MRKGVLAIVGVAALLGGWAVWRSPTAALVSLKLALDRRDLSAVERVLDYRALTDAALSRLVDGRPEEPADIRLVLRGENAWVPALSSARGYLRIRLERGVERLVEDPEHGLELSWEDLRRALTSLRRSGSVARFRVPGPNGEEYIIRMRQARGRWKIVAIDRDGEPILLGPADTQPPAATADSGAAGGNGNGAAPEEAVADADGVERDAAEEHLGALVDEASELVRALPHPPRPRTGKQSPFLRKLPDGAWTVQVASTVDAVEADLEREWLDSVGEPAYIEEAEIRGRTWRRVMVGRYPTRAGAEETLERLTEQGGEPDATARR
jgi:sporulation related protein